MEISINLNKRGSINEAIKKLKAYRKELNDKLEKLIETLANDGVIVARSWLGAAQGDSSRAEIGLDFDNEGYIYRAIINLSGQDALFIEFGAGYYYNASDPPHAAEFGYGVGTYPGQKYAFQRGWYYYDESGELVYSHGTEGTYPLYHASENMRNNLIVKALDVFRS